MIRLSTEEEALELMQLPEIVKRIGTFATSVKVQPWMCDQEGKKMLFFFWEVNKETEIHVVCYRDSVLQSRSLGLEIIDWLKKLGAKSLITNCPINRGKIVNYLKNLGFRETSRDDSTIQWSLLWA